MHAGRGENCKVLTHGVLVASRLITRFRCLLVYKKIYFEPLPTPCWLWAHRLWKLSATSSGCSPLRTRIPYFSRVASSCSDNAIKRLWSGSSFSDARSFARGRSFMRSSASSSSSLTNSSKSSIGCEGMLGMLGGRREAGECLRPTQWLGNITRATE